MSTGTSGQRDQSALWLSAGALLAITLGALSWSQPDIDSSDVWWHLASGRHIWEQGGFTYADPFSHTAAGQPWLNYEWLWGWLSWHAYRASPDLLAFLNLALVGATFSLVAVSARRASQSWLVAGAVTWIAAANCHWFFDVRPHLVTLFFTAALLATLDSKRAPWLWAPIMIVWANMHAGFVFGIGLLGLRLLVDSGQALRSQSPLPKAGWAGLAVAMLCVAVNPWGFEMYAVPLHVVDPNTPFRDLIEWHPLQIASLDPRTHDGRFAWTLLIAVPALWYARRDPYRVALALVALIMAFSARRFIALFAVAGAPAIAMGLAPAWQWVRGRLPAVDRTSLQAVGIAGAFGLSALLWQDVRLFPQPLYRWTQSEAHPSGGVSYLNQRANPPQRLLHFFNWGGYLAMHGQDIKTFIDGRAATVYSPKIGRDYLTLYGAQEGWRALIAEYEIDGVLVEPHSPIAQALSRERPPWSLVHADHRSILLFPPGSSVERTVKRDPESTLLPSDLNLGRAYMAGMRGKKRAAVRALEKVVKEDPLQLHAYGELMRLAALREDATTIERLTDDMLDAYPRRVNRVWGYAEHAWLVAGRPEERLDALKRIHLGSPFINDEVLRGYADRLYEARHRASLPGP